jgi:hypothetical protein
MELGSINVPKPPIQKSSSHISNTALSAAAQFKTLIKKKIDTLEKDAVEEVHKEEGAHIVRNPIKIEKITPKHAPAEDTIDQTLDKIKDRIKALIQLSKS